MALYGILSHTISLRLVLRFKRFQCCLSFLERLTLPDIWIDGAVDDERGGEGSFVEVKTDVLCLVALQYYSTFMDNHITSSHLRRGNLFLDLGSFKTLFWEYFRSFYFISLDNIVVDQCVGSENFNIRFKIIS